MNINNWLKELFQKFINKIDGEEIWLKETNDKMDKEMGDVKSQKSEVKK